MTSACDNLLHPKPKSELQVYAQQTVIANGKLSVRGEMVNCQKELHKVERLKKKFHVESILTSNKNLRSEFSSFSKPYPLRSLL